MLSLTSHRHITSNTPYCSLSTHSSQEHLPNNRPPTCQVTVTRHSSESTAYLPFLIDNSCKNSCSPNDNKLPALSIYSNLLQYHEPAKDGPKECLQLQQGGNKAFRLLFPPFKCWVKVLVFLFFHCNRNKDLDI